jgi:hypothetical protein
MRNESACWVGVFAVSAFFVLIAWDVSSIRHVQFYREQANGHYWRYEYEKLLAIGPNRDGLGQLLFTTPTLNSIAYSVGSWLALRFDATKAIAS